MLARIAQPLTTVLRHLVPIGGIFGRDWHPVTALVVYWLESVLLALAAVTLCAMMQRRASAAEIKVAGIQPRDVLLFHVGSLFVFGAFLAGVLVILIGNGHIDGPFSWREMREGAAAMLLILSAGFILDLWRFDTFSVAAVQARVDACTGRWALFWLLGFFGTLLMMFTGRPAFFLGLFAVLKPVFESWPKIAGLFGSRNA